MIHPLKITISLLILLFSSFAFGGQININTAGVEALAKELNGVGQVKAHAIVEYREQHGAFKTINALANVKGIGSAIVSSNQKNIKLDAVD